MEMENAHTPIKPGRIQYYRQPIVTTTGILLGFVLNFASGWLQSAFSIHWLKDLVIAVTLMGCVTLLIIVLFRVLNMNYPRERHAEEMYYKRTLRMFLIGISLPFISIVSLIILKVLNEQIIAVK